MSRKPKREVKLCPFKKMVVQEDNRAERAKIVTHEMFEDCAGERCMAYNKATTGAYCLRLMNDQS